LLSGGDGTSFDGHPLPAEEFALGRDRHISCLNDRRGTGT